jgi:pyruvate/oxaloacetate carboxyltransferase
VTRMLALLNGHERCPKTTEAQTVSLRRVRSHLEKVYEELSAFTGHKNEIIDTDTLEYQVPGGMLSNFRTQLKEQKMEDKFDEVFREIPVVREALGWIPLVTPTSQIVGMQAFLNVKFGRWKQISPQTADIALGYYGRTPAPVDPELQKLAEKQSGKTPITCRPVDAPGMKHKHMEDLRRELKEKGFPSDDEHCVIYAMFPQQLEAYLKSDTKGTAPAAKPATAPAVPAAPAVAPAATGSAGPKKHYALHIDGKRVEVGVEEIV